MKTHLESFLFKKEFKSSINEKEKKLEYIEENSCTWLH
jgi:hypothetical protein